MPSMPTRLRSLCSPLYWPNSPRSSAEPLTAPRPTLTMVSTALGSACAGEKAAHTATASRVRRKQNEVGKLVMISLRTSAHHELWHRVNGRWVIGTMNLRVAVQATATLPQVDHVLAAGGPGDIHAALATERPHATRHVRRMA